MKWYNLDKIQLGIIGIGAMGKGLLYQSTVTQVVHCGVICDIDLKKCISAAEFLGLDYRVVENVQDMKKAIESGKLAICEDGELITRCEIIEVVIEASNSIIPAGNFAVQTLNNKKHLVLMNSEIDLIFGPYLMKLAEKNGVEYTSCDGDQYGIIKHLIDDIQFWGFDLVMAGNIKGYLDRYANPASIVPEADKRNLDYTMCTSYTDGTKLSIEMAITANSYGLLTLKPGMLGPRASHVREVFQLFDLEKILESNNPVVDYVLGAEPAGGVFVIGYCDNLYQQQMMSYYKMGEGPFYLFYRPYHLCHIEAMKSVLNAVNKGIFKEDGTKEKYRMEGKDIIIRKGEKDEGEVRNGHWLMQPEYGFCTNVYAYAKRDLKKGEVLDGIGGYNCYGLIENVSEEQTGLPICLAEGLTLKRDIYRDEKINLTDVWYNPDRSDFDLFYKAVQVSNEIQSRKGR